MEPATNNNLMEQLRQIVSEVSKIDPDFDSKAHFYNDLGIPSVKALHLLMTLEERFAVSIQDDQFVEANSLENLFALMSRLVES